MSDVGKTFEIILKPHFHDGKKFKMKVTVTYRSDQVVRFLVEGGQKYIVLEKRLLSNKINTWKVPDTNVDLIASGIEKSNYTLYEIQEHLDYYLKKDNLPPRGNPKYEH